MTNVGPLKAQLKGRVSPFGASDARAIRVPTLLVSGAKSPAPLKAVIDRLAKLIPDAERLTIAGATHNMCNSHPAEFNAGVLRFIRSHSLAGRRPGARHSHWNAVGHGCYTVSRPCMRWPAQRRPRT